MGKYYLIVDIEEDDQGIRCEECIFNPEGYQTIGSCMFQDNEDDIKYKDLVKDCPLIAVEDVDALNKLLNPPKQKGLVGCSYCRYLLMHEDQPSVWQFTCGNPDGKYHRGNYKEAWMPGQIDGLGCEKGEWK